MHPYDRCYVPGWMSCHLGGTHHLGPMLSLNGGGVCDPTTEAERTLGTCCHQVHALIPVITVVNPCRRDLTLASRGVRIAITDLTPFLHIRSYGGLATKVICTFHPTTETLWDSTR
ncbi:hypothetical protein PIB30_047441 [Stylosanthes scabra]|uniref:Uncharacterized protein n=1 Tax=Stylosanthes scabra TaxID=79078 RepID=A0ABU6VFK6_9FABA|nr:hypothetical protein [Stylosanthes scabra]